MKNSMENNTERLDSLIIKVTTIIAIAMSLFHIFTGFFGVFDAYLQRTIHLTFAVTLIFLPFLAGKKKFTRIFDLCLMVGMFFISAYIFFNYNYIVSERYSMVTPLTTAQRILGAMIILLIVEATRRVIGKTLAILVLIFVIYAFIGTYLPGVLHHTGVFTDELLDYQYLSTEGLFGIPLGVSATYVAPFIIFATLLKHTGISTFMFDISAAIAGRTKGGPAKVAVITSGLMGMISGSGTANVVTTGSVTIPMMKKVGYKPHFAAAVEAVASTGGQIMPPIMGATAFVISAFTGIPYITICKYAIFPAILYFLAVYFMVQLEAEKIGLTGMEEKTEWKAAIKNYWHMVIPILFLVFLLLRGFSVMLAGSYSILAVVVFSMFRKGTRLDPSKLLKILEESGKSMVIVALPCAAAGIIIGVVALTGIGVRFTNSLMALSGGNIYVALVLAMIAAIILGMGMPTTAAYIIQVALVIPALVAMGLPVYVAHLFAFYFACISLITPPVAITSYTAASMAGADPMKTSWCAMKLGLAAYIIPFMFVFGPSLLLVGSFFKIVTTVSTALIGIFFLAVGLEGYLFTHANVIVRGIALIAALLLISPKIYMTIPGLLFMGLVLILQKIKHDRLLN